MGRKLGVFVGICLVLLLGGCASTSDHSEPFYTRLYIGKYDDVWLATLKALNDYPLKLSNKDSGKIQSEVVNGPYNDLLFQYPEPIELPERFRYSLKLAFAKLVTEDDQPLTRVRIIKDLERFQDFYTGWLPYPSDGLEEKILLYRIEHILRMQEALSRRQDEDKDNKDDGQSAEPEKGGGSQDESGGGGSAGGSGGNGSLDPDQRSEGN
jgi:uncharacterized membrane protein YgcG